MTEASVPGGPPPTPDSVPWAPKPIPAGSAFIGLCAMRNGEAQLRWQGAQLAFLLNLPAYTAVVYRLIHSEVPMLEVKVIAFGSLIFAFANLFFSRVLDRDNQYVTMWNDFLAELERLNHIEGGLEAFSSMRYQRLRNARGRLQERLLIAIRGCMFIWLAMSLVAVAIIYWGEIKGVVIWLTQWLNT